MKKSKKVIKSSVKTSSQPANQPEIEVDGFQSLQGNRFVRAKVGKAYAYVPFAEFMGGDPRRFLAEQDLILPNQRYRDFLRMVEELTKFERRPIVEHAGWTGNHFALPCGSVISPPGRPRGIAVFRASPNRCTFGGGGPEWRDSLAALVAEQIMPAFLVMAAFASPLLRLTSRVDNFGFELAGPRATGKTTCLRLIASVLGAGVDSGQGVYWQTLNSTAAGLETEMARHEDLPMILDEASMFLATDGPRARASGMVHIAFQLGSGRAKGRYQSAQAETHRFIFVISSNEPAAEVMRGNSHVREQAALDRLLTLPLPAEGYGVFDSLPNGVESGAQFSSMLDRAMAQNYGLAMRRFLRLLVDEREENEGRLKRRIADKMARFRRAAGVDPNDGSAVRVSDAFGLVYAAGCLAWHWDILPDPFRCREIALEAYRRHLACRDQRSPREKLRDLLSAKDVLRVPRGGLKGLTSDKIENAAGLIYEGKKEQELLLTRGHLRRSFPLSPKIHSDLVWALRRDKDNDKVKRKVSSNLEPKRFYCFPVANLRDD